MISGKTEEGKNVINTSSKEVEETAAETTGEVNSKNVIN
jgi:hypothetical protein